MGIRKRDIQKLGWQVMVGHEDLHPFPHRDLLEAHQLDDDFIEWEFRSLRLTPRDAYIEIDGGAIRLAYLLDNNGRARKKFKAPQYYRCDELNSKIAAPDAKPISRNELRDTINDFEPKFEKSVGSVILKMPLRAAVKSVNDYLKAKADQSIADFPFERELDRARYIADWVNWFFIQTYRIKSNYSAEQIRKMF